MNVYEIVKSYSKLKGDMVKYVADKYDFANNDGLGFNSFDVILDEQD